MVKAGKGQLWVLNRAKRLAIVPLDSPDAAPITYEEADAAIKEGMAAAGKEIKVAAPSAGSSAT